MGYELKVPLKRGTLEIEFDTVDELEEKLAALDVPRIERAVAKATRTTGAPRKATAGKGAAKKRARKAAKGSSKKAK